MAPRVPFAEWRPDIDDNLGIYTRNATNVVPKPEGYGPVPSLNVLATLPGVCRGYTYGRNSDGSITIFAGTATKLYQLNNTTFTWTDVSKGAGNYGGPPTGDHWQFAQFGSFVFATNINDPLQVFTLGSSTAFADAAGTPPQARYIAVVFRFLVLTGISGQPRRVQWSGLNSVNAASSWDNVTAGSNFQDLPDGGLVRGVGGGETGLITQDAGLRSMVYQPGSPVIFQIDRISEEKGIFAPLSLTRSGDRLFWVGIDGFKMRVPGGYPQPIGKGKFDDTFFADVDTNALQYCIGASDPRATRVYFAYKSLAGAAGLFDKIICYDWALDRASLVKISGEYIATLAKPGLTLENLDPIAPGALTIVGATNNGSGLIRIQVASTSTLSTGQIKAISGVTGTTEANGNWAITVFDGQHFDLQGSTFVNAYVSGGVVGGSLDALSFSLDDISLAAFAQVSLVNSSHGLGFLSSTNLEATVETAELGYDGKRMFIGEGFQIIGDMPSAFGSLSGRENLQATATYTNESAMNALQACPQVLSTRFMRMKARIPAGTVWSIIKGAVPKGMQEDGDQ